MLLNEPDAPSIIAALRESDLRLSSRLLAIELRRLAFRSELVHRGEELLDGIALAPLEEDLLREAERVLPAAVATLNAIHLATAVRLAQGGKLSVMLTYDRALAAGARANGLTVVSPA